MAIHRVFTREGAFLRSGHPTSCEPLLTVPKSMISAIITCEAQFNFVQSVGPHGLYALPVDASHAAKTALSTPHICASQVEILYTVNFRAVGGGHLVVVVSNHKTSALERDLAIRTTVWGAIMPLQLRGLRAGSAVQHSQACCQLLYLSTTSTPTRLSHNRLGYAGQVTNHRSGSFSRFPGPASGPVRYCGLPHPVFLRIDTIPRPPSLDLATKMTDACRGLLAECPLLDLPQFFSIAATSSRGQDVWKDVGAVKGDRAVLCTKQHGYILATTGSSRSWRKTVYSRSPKNPALQLSQKCSQSASRWS